MKNCVNLCSIAKKECGRRTLRGNRLNKSWVCVRDRPTGIQMKDLGWDIRAKSNLIKLWARECVACILGPDVNTKKTGELVGFILLVSL